MIAALTVKEQHSRYWWRLNLKTTAGEIVVVYDWNTFEEGPSDFLRLVRSAALATLQKRQELPNASKFENGGPRYFGDLWDPTGALDLVIAVAEREGYVLGELDGQL